MANYTWVGTDSSDPTDWNDPNNWLVAGSPATVPPGLNDNVTIDAGTSIASIGGSGQLQSASLTLTAGTGGSVDLTGSFYTGAIDLTGVLQLQGGMTDTGTATFANGATLEDGTTSVQGAATFGATFTLENGELDLSASSTATLSTLNFVGAVTMSGNITTTSLSDSGATSVSLGGGTFDVTSSTPSAPAQLAPLTISGDSTLVGAFSTSSLTVTSGAALNLNAGDSLTAASAAFDPSDSVSLTDGTLLITGNASLGSSLTVSGAGSFTVDGTLSTDGGSIGASDNSRVLIGELNGSGGSVSLSADSTSVIEIGSANSATTGSITIDSEIDVVAWGSFSAPIIVVDGTIGVVSDQELSLDGSGRGLTGDGIVQIGAGSLLSLNVVDPGSSDKVQIDFVASGGLLSLNPSDLNASGAFVPTIKGFGSTDVIDFTDDNAAITSATYAGGELSLYDGTTLTASLDIGTGFTNAFSVLPINGNTYQIDYLGGGTHAAPAGTTTADSYQWIGAVAGAWNVATNWADTTASQSPASVAPGANDIITIAAAANGAAQVLVGNGNAYGLTLEGETLLDGVFKVGGTGANGGLTMADSAVAVLNAGSSLTVAGNAAFDSFAAGVTLNGGTMSVTGTFYGSYSYGNDTTYIESGGSLTMGALVGDSSGFSIAAGSVLTVKGNVSDSSVGSGYSVSGAGADFTVKGTFISTNDGVYASGGGQIQLAGLTEDANGNGVNLTVADTSSSIEIGKTGGAAAGSLTIDTGIKVTEAGSFSAPSIVNNGTLAVAADESLTLAGTIAGSGSFSIGAGSTLAIQGDTNGGPAVKIAFSGTGGMLTLNTGDLNASNEFVPTIKGFGSTDVIDFTDDNAAITSATYASGELNLYNGTTLTASLDIGTGYKNAFSVLPIAGGDTFQIDYLGGGTSAAPAGTATSDSYEWIGAVAGAWNVATNWADTTTSQSPASVAPGAKDIVTIAAAANGAVQVLIGNGNAYGLTLEGETLLDGVFKIGGTGANGGLTMADSAVAVLDAGSSLTVAGDAVFDSFAAGVTLNGGTMSVTGTFYGSYSYGNDTTYIESGGSLTVGALVDDSSGFSIAAGSVLTVEGNVSDSSYGSGYSVSGAGADFTVKGTFISTNDGVYASGGGQIQLAGLTEDANGNGVTLTVADTSSSIEIGKTGAAAAGSLTIDTGIKVTEWGSFTAPIIVDNGTLTVAPDESLTLTGTITGSGTLSIGAGSTLAIQGDANGSAVKIAFSGAGGTLSFNTNELNGVDAFAPTIKGFGSTDVIDFADYVAVLTSATYASGELNLYDGTTLTASLDIGTGYKNQFSVLPVDGGNTYQIDYLGGGTNAAPAGTTTADSYEWIGLVAGDWNVATNWADTTAGQSPAALAPGANDIITIAAAANGAAQVLVGNGNAYGLTLEGETLLYGVFDVGGTGANGGFTVMAGVSAVLDAGSSLTVAGDATFDIYSGAGVTLNGATMSVTGTFYGSYTYTNQTDVIENGGSLTMGALVGDSSGFSIAAGSVLTVKSNVSDSSVGSGYSVSGAGADFTVKGTFISTNDGITASAGGQVQLAALMEDANGNGVNLTVADTSSSIEIGATGGAAAGSLTIDTGIKVTEAGSFTAPTVVNNGTLTVAPDESLTLTGTITGSGTLSAGAGSTLSIDGTIRGSGPLSIGAGSTLAIQGDTNGSAVKIVFSGTGDLLSLNADDLNASGAFVPTIKGFGATDVIDFTDDNAAITGATYASGELSLYSGTTLIASLDIGTGYKNQFSVLPVDGGNTYQIDYLGGGTNAAPAGTTTADSYEWIGPVAGDWNVATNWADTTAGQSPAALAPGANDILTVTAAVNGAAQVLIGNGNAYGLTLEGETLLYGVFDVGGTGANGGFTVANGASAVLDAGSSLTVAGDATFDPFAGVTLNGGTMSVTGTFYGGYDYNDNIIIENGGSLTVGALANDFSGFSIAAGSTLTVKGNVSDSSFNSSYSVNGAGADFTVKGTFISSNDSVYASDGGQIQLAGLAEDVNGNGVTLTVADTSSSIEIGTTGGAAAGTLTIDAGIKVTEAGSFSAPTIVENGMLTAAAGESLSLGGAITGSGTLSLAAGSTLTLDSGSVATTDKVAFIGIDATLSLLTPLDFTNHSVTGFGPGDAVDLSGSWSLVSFSENAGGTAATLKLTDGTNDVSLKFAGDYAQGNFSISSGSTTTIDYAAPGALLFGAETQSSGATNNIATNFDFGHDQFALWLPVTGIDATVTASGLSELRGAFGTDLHPGRAALADIDSHVFLVVDSDGKAGYHADDLMFALAGMHSLSSLSTGDFVVA